MNPNVLPMLDNPTLKQRRMRLKKNTDKVPNFVWALIAIAACGFSFVLGLAIGLCFVPEVLVHLAKGN